MGLPSPILLISQNFPWQYEAELAGSFAMFLFVGGSFLVFLLNTTHYSISVFRVNLSPEMSYPTKLTHPIQPSTTTQVSVTQSRDKWRIGTRNGNTWPDHHRRFYAGASKRIFLVTGSQPSACNNPAGDHLLLKLSKNKMDYCRIHGHEMGSHWAKLPITGLNLAHPEVEWIWWMGSDAVFTYMEFKVP